jgi:desulfoferrodoxin ferrous iron-binding domain
MKFIKCEDCESIAVVLSDGKCCSGENKELVPNTVDAAVEKHVPYVVIEGNVLKVQVGEVEHPMLKEHYIQWIAVETKSGLMVKKLQPEQKPFAQFNIEGEEVVAVYEYCNLHGLWKKEM